MIQMEFLEETVRCSIPSNACEVLYPNFIGSVFADESSGNILKATVSNADQANVTLLQRNESDVDHVRRTFLQWLANSPAGISNRFHYLADCVRPRT